MRLVEVELDQVAALLRGEALERPVAPGWPHQDTLTGLGFVRLGGSQFLVIDDDGLVAGECGTKAPPDELGAVEIGYGLAATSRGRGLGGRAVAELVDWLAAQPTVHTIEAEIQISNTPSRRVVERLGFTADGPPVQGYLRYRRAARIGG